MYTYGYRLHIYSKFHARGTLLIHMHAGVRTSHCIDPMYFILTYVYAERRQLCGLFFFSWSHRYLHEPSTNEEDTWPVRSHIIQSGISRFGSGARLWHASLRMLLAHVNLKLQFMQKKKVKQGLWYACTYQAMTKLPNLYHENTYNLPTHNVGIKDTVVRIPNRTKTNIRADASIIQEMSLAHNDKIFGGIKKKE